ncbi:MAG: TRAP transporter small permease [Chloroflexi bacterium]|nr:TRAP transporter small permease [Chloroflexota bacterium]
MKSLGASFDRLLTFFSVVGMLLIAGMMLAVVAKVAMRYFFNSPIVWVIDITEYAMLFITFLGTAWLLKREGHVIMDLLLDRLNHKNRHLAIAITSVVAATTCFIITWYGVVVGFDWYNINYFYQGALDIPAFYLEAVIPVGMLLVAIQFLRRAYNNWKLMKAR